MTREHHRPSLVRGKGPGVGLNEIYEPVKGVKHVDWGIDYMCRHIDEGELDMDPDYQRGHVWTEEQQMDFVGFVMEGGRPPEVFVRELPYMTTTPTPPYYEIVDGKQRLTALHAWYHGKIPARLSEEHGQALIWVTDLDEVELRHAKHNMNSSIQFLDSDRKKTLRIYLRLNRGGTPHTDAEIERVRKLYEAESDEDLPDDGSDAMTEHDLDAHKLHDVAGKLAREGSKKR